jgi:uncharacterized protein (DUF2252 family)
VPHLSLAERAARGKATRAEVPRRSHASWEPALGRRDPVELLEEQAISRVPELIPIRYGRMLVSPFTFYRGAAYLMAADLAGTPRTGLHVQLCGDAHLSNFGGFAAPDRRLVFGVNDFDETLPGPFEWDLKRLVASFAVAGRDRGFDAKERHRVNRMVTRAYREAMRELASMRSLDLWYSRIDVDEIAEVARKQGTAKQIARLDKNLAKTRAKDSLRAFNKLTTMVDGEPRIAADAPLIVPIEDLADGRDRKAIEEFIHGVIRGYRRTLQRDRRRLLERFRYVHAARKVVGVGSVGTRAWIVLLVGHDNDDPLFMQAKEAQASVLEPFLGKSEFASHGQRVVEGQRLMQAASDIMLGWVAGHGSRRRRAGLLPAPAVGSEGLGDRGADEPHSHDPVREALRADARQSTRPVGRRRHARKLHGRQRLTRSRDGGLRRDLRRPERAGLPSAQGRRRQRPNRGNARPVVRTAA